MAYNIHHHPPCNENEKMKKKTSSLGFFLLFSIISLSLLILVLTRCFSVSYHVPFADVVQQIPTISCDRTAFHTDVCHLRGGYVHTHSPSNSIILHPSSHYTAMAPPPDQLIRPYPRKWETPIMTTIPELRLGYSADASTLPCDVRHDVPAIIFSAGGYTGNLFHEFNDGILPLYITARPLRRRVVLLVLDYRNWWFTKYQDLLSRLSDFPPIDFDNDTRIHCFPQAIVGLRTHGDLTADPSDFHQMLDEAYSGPRIGSPAPAAAPAHWRPRLVMVSRNGSRAIENEGEVVAAAEEVGFSVVVLRPDRTTELATMYRVLNGSDAMVGVHGAALTHFLFMRPGSAFIQVVPLGARWAAETCFGEPAVKMGLWYSAYRVRPEESSLSREYGRDDPVLRDPEAVTTKGWEVTKRVYLEKQNVRLDIRRFRRCLIDAYRYLTLKRHISS